MYYNNHPKKIKGFEVLGVFDTYEELREVFCEGSDVENASVEEQDEYLREYHENWFEPQDTYLEKYVWIML